MPEQKPGPPLVIVMMQSERKAAARHFSRNAILLNRQRARVARLSGSGEAAWMARQFLARLEELQTSFESHLRFLEQEAREDR